MKVKKDGERKRVQYLNKQEVGPTDSEDGAVVKCKKIELVNILE